MVVFGLVLMNCSNRGDDVALCIIQHLPYPSLGRLAQTCKWMNTNITDKHVEHAVDRFLKRFQKIELFDEPPLIISSSSPRGHHHHHHRNIMIRMFSTNEEVVEVGWMHRMTSDTTVLLRIQGQVFMGPPAIPTDNVYHKTFTEFFDHVVSSISDCSEEEEPGNSSSSSSPEEKPFGYVRYSYYSRNPGHSTATVHAEFVLYNSCSLIGWEHPSSVDLSEQ